MRFCEYIVKYNGLYFMIKYDIYENQAINEIALKISFLRKSYLDQIHMNFTSYQLDD